MLRQNRLPHSALNTFQTVVREMPREFAISCNVTFFIV